MTDHDPGDEDDSDTKQREWLYTIAPQPGFLRNLWSSVYEQLEPTTRAAWRRASRS